MSSDSLSAAKVNGSLGAEIGNVDLAADLDQPVIDQITTALVENGVIYFRNQDPSAERQIANLDPKDSDGKAYIAYRRDPDGNKICAMWKSARRSGGGLSAGHAQARRDECTPAAFCPPSIKAAR